MITTDGVTAAALELQAYLRNPSNPRPKDKRLAAIADDLRDGLGDPSRECVTCGWWPPRRVGVFIQLLQVDFRAYLAGRYVLA